MMDQIPQRYLWELHGGVSIAKEHRRRGDDPPDVFLLGEYVVDEHLGRLIIIYYGSFTRVFAGDPHRTIQQELWETLLHELRHHIEDMAGIDDLNGEDRVDLDRLRGLYSSDPH